MPTVTDADREIRVLHIVSDAAISAGLQPTLFMPLLTRTARQRVQHEVICMAAQAVPAAMLRQHGVPVHDIPFPSVGWSPRPAAEARQVARQFLPDLIQAWGLEAQLLSMALARRCEPRPALIWCMTHTEPLPAQAGWLQRRRLMQAVRLSGQVERLVYASSASAARHVRLGFTGQQHEIINPGVDALRFRPDAQARSRLREQLQVPKDALVVGMHAPLQAGSGHEYLLRAASELVRSHPQLHLLLAGHGVSQGNAALMSMMGNGVLATRSQLLGEWSDLAGFYNACDLVCAAGLDDSARMHLAMAMLCGVPCVATGPGAQGEVLARHGAVVEPGNAKALLKGMRKLLDMDASQRKRMTQGARQHAMMNYVHVRTLQKYLHLYCNMLGIEQLPPPVAQPAVASQPARPAASMRPAAVAAAATPPDASADDARAAATATALQAVGADEFEASLAGLPKWRQAQEREQRRRAAQVAAAVAAASSEGDVLQLFEQRMQQPVQRDCASAERARGVADESEILLPPEVLGMTVEMEVTEEALLAAGWRSEDAARLVASSRSAADDRDDGSASASSQPAVLDAAAKVAASGPHAVAGIESPPVAADAAADVEDSRARAGVFRILDEAGIQAAQAALGGGEDSHHAAPDSRVPASESTGSTCAGEDHLARSAADRHAAHSGDAQDTREDAHSFNGQPMAAGGQARLDEIELSLVATGTQPVISPPMPAAANEHHALALLEESPRQSLEATPLALVDEEPPRRSHGAAVMDC